METQTMQRERNGLELFIVADNRKELGGRNMPLVIVLLCFSESPARIFHHVPPPCRSIGIVVRGN